MLCVVMLSVAIMLSVIMLNVVMLSVVVPFQTTNSIIIKHLKKVSETTILN